MTIFLAKNSDQTICPIFMKIRVEVVYRMLCSKQEFHENRLKVLRVKSVNVFVTHFPHFLTDFLEIRYRFPRNCVER